MHVFWHRLFDGLQAGEEASAPRCSLVAVAGGLAALYDLGARMRRALYAWSILRARRLPAPVVSVGNLTVGGTGKTPVTACLTRLFQAQGRKVAILSRGYGGQNQGVACISDGRQITKNRRRRAKRPTGWPAPCPGPRSTPGPPVMPRA